MRGASAEKGERESMTESAKEQTSTTTDGVMPSSLATINLVRDDGAYDFQDKCPKCGAEEFKMVNKGIVYRICDCVKHEEKLVNRFGEWQVTSDGCRWRVLGFNKYGANELMVDPVQYRKDHCYYFRECYASTNDRIELVRRNIKSFKSVFNPKEQLDLPMGWDGRWKGPLKGEPVWIVGSGPSLKQIAPAMKDVPGYVISLNSSIRLLERCDWWMFCDYGWNVNNWFRGKQPVIPERGAIISTHANDSILDYKWNTISFYHNNNIGPLTTCAGITKAGMPEVKMELVSGHEVMFSALHAAYCLGAGAIFLVGADHCYSDEYHAGLGDMSLMPGHDRRRHDRFGNPVRTTDELQLTAMYIESAALALGAAGIPVVDLSPSSILSSFVWSPYEQGFDIGEIKKLYANGKRVSSVGYVGNKDDGRQLLEFGISGRDELHQSKKIPMELLSQPGGTWGKEATGVVDFDAGYDKVRDKFKEMAGGTK